MSTHIVFASNCLLGAQCLLSCLAYVSHQRETVPVTLEQGGQGRLGSWHSAPPCPGFPGLQLNRALLWVLSGEFPGSMVYWKALASKQESKPQLPPQSCPHLTAGEEGSEHKNVSAPDAVDL